MRSVSFLSVVILLVGIALSSCDFQSEPEMGVVAPAGGSGANSAIPWNSSVSYGKVTDSRDGRSYRTVKIGTQMWMAENLNYRNVTGSNDSVGVCYNNSTDSCTKYGRLYTWTEAMALSSSYNSLAWGGSDVQYQGICPSGWHVPSDAEWTVLVSYVGDSTTAGTKLKSTNGWYMDAGTDTYGFRILPAGLSTTYGEFGMADFSACFWSSSEFDTSHAFDREFSNTYAGNFSRVSKSDGYSLRCVEGAGMMATTTVALPTFSLSGGSYTGSRTVRISSATSNAMIYYTTDGSTPTTLSMLDTGLITVSTSETIKAIAVKSGMINSLVASAAYAITVPAPTFNLSGSAYMGSRTVWLNDSDYGAAIYYTTDGSAPTTTSTLYRDSITLSASKTIKAVAVKSGVASAVASVDILVVIPPAFSPPPGSYAGTVQVALTTLTPNANIRYSSTSTDPDRTSVIYSSPLSISSTTTLRAATEVSDTLGRPVSATYVIFPASTVAVPSIGLASGTYVGRQQVSLSDATSGAQIRYTLNGQFPTKDDSLYTVPLSISSSTTLRAVAFVNGISSQSATAAYTIQKIQAPSFNPSGGTYKGNQAVFITSGTSGASIHCTTDGTTPTASSPTCNSPITVYAGTTFISAVATYGGNVSRVNSAIYTITGTGNSGGGEGGGTSTCSCLYTKSQVRGWIATDSDPTALANDQLRLEKLIQCGCP